MPGITASSLDQDYPAKFFHSHAIDEFVVVSSLAIPAPFGRRPVDLFPTCRTMILFGKVMGDDLFEGSVPETAPKITAFKQELARISDELVNVFKESGSFAVAVNSVMVKDGNLKRQSLTQTLCPGRRHGGNRRQRSSPVSAVRDSSRLDAVLTDREIPTVTARGDPVHLCTHYGRCLKACPVNALDCGGMDTFRCLNITGSIPSPFVSLFIRLMGTKTLEPLLTKIANRIATRSTARCSACLMACPYFKKYGGT